MNRELVPTGRMNTILPANATDELVIDLWLKQKGSEATRREYSRDIRRFLAFVGKQLREINLLDLQTYKESMAGKKPTVARRLASVKSLLTFCQRSGYTTLNVGAALSGVKVEEKLAERIMSEAQIQRLLALESNPRNHAMLRLMYNTGARVSEIVALTWNDIQARSEGAQVRLFGKGQKERYVLISAETYQELLTLKENALDFAPVFVSRKKVNGGWLTRGQVNQIVEAAAIRAGIALYEKNGRKRSRVSPHWFRHAHASHSIDNGASMPLVRDTLGHKSIITTNKYAHARPGQSSGTYLKV